MSIHKDKTHHRPRVEKLPRSSVWYAFGWRWESSCSGCGHFRPRKTWKQSLIDALAHARELR